MIEMPKELKNTFMTTNEDRVVITIEEYCDLIQDSQALNALLNAMLENANLSYHEEYLTFDDSKVCHVLSALCRPQYYAMLNDLKRKRMEEKNGTDKSEE